MESNFNLGSLKIVQAPLADYFKQATKNIEDNLVLLGERKPVANYDVIGVISKIQKTLKMIGLFGFSKVLSASEDGLEIMKRNELNIEKQIQLFEMIDLVLKNGALYLKLLANGNSDQPVKFFEYYKKISEITGKEVFVKDLFSPKLDFKSDFSEEIQQDLKVGVFINEKNKETLVSHLNKVNQIVAIKIPDVLKFTSNHNLLLNPDEKTKYQSVCKNLYDVLDHLQKLKISKNFYILSGLQKFYICVLSPVFNEKFVEYVTDNDKTVNHIIAGMVESTNNLFVTVKGMEEGEKTGSLKASESYIKDLLFEILNVINSNPKLTEMPVFKDLENYFDLVSYSDQLIDTRIDLVGTTFSNESILQTERLFGELKEEFSNLGNKRASTTEIMQGQLQKVIQINNKLTESLVSVKEVNVLLAEMGAGLMLVKNGTNDFTEVLEKELSMGLVLTEYGINNFVKNSFENRNRTDFGKQIRVQVERIKIALTNDLEKLAAANMPVLDAVSQKSDEKKTFTKIFDQLHQELVKVEETIDMFLRSDRSDVEDLVSIFKPLSGMKGIFSIVGKPVLSSAIDEIIVVWKEVSKEGFANTNQEKISDSVSLLSGISLFINAFKNENEAEADEIYENILKKFSHLQNIKENNVLASVPEIQESVKEDAVENKPVVLEKTTIEHVVEEVHFQEPVQVEKTVEISSEAQYTETTNDPELAEFFLMEADEVLGEMTTTLKELTNNIGDMEKLKDVRRYFHTLKGSGRMVGLEFFGEAGWMVEQTLNRVLGGELELTPELFQEVQKMKENFAGWVNDLKTDNSVSIDLVSIKKRFLKLNPNIKNHVEINVDTVEENTQLEFDFLDQPQNNLIESEVNNDVVQELPSIEMPLDIELESAIQVEIQPEPEPEIAMEMELGLELETESKEETSELSFSDIDLEIENMEVNQAIEVDGIDLNAESSIGFIEDSTPTEEVKEEANLDLELELDSESFLETTKETMIIDGKEVSSSLFDLFLEESAEHIKALKDFVESNYSSEVELTESFMRHSHTLASISRTVNMQKIAEVSSLAENIATITIDKQMMLNAEDMNIIRHAVNSLDNFRVVNSDNDNTSYYNNIIEHLNELHKKIVDQQFDDKNVLIDNSHRYEESPVMHGFSDMESYNDNQGVDISPVNEGGNVGNPSEIILAVQDMLNGFANDVSDSFKTNILVVNKNIDEMRNQMEMMNGGVSSEEFDAFSKNIHQEITSQHRNIVDSLERENESQKEVIRVLLEKMSNMENKIRELDNGQKMLDSVGKDRIDSVKKDIRILANILKKKSELTFKEILPISVREEILKEMTEEVFIFEDKYKDIFSHSKELEVQLEEKPEPELELLELEEVKFEDNIEYNIEESFDNVVSVDNLIEEEKEVKELNMEKVDIEDFSISENNSSIIFEEIVFDKPVEIKGETIDSKKVAGINQFLDNHNFIKTIFEEKISTVVDEFDPEMYEISKPEAEEMMEKIIPIVQSIKESGLDDSSSDELKRYLHTFKGSVRMAGSNKMGMLAHRLESLMDYVSDRKINMFLIKDLLETEVEKINYLMTDPSQVLTENINSWLDSIFVESNENSDSENTVVVDSVYSNVEQVSQIKEDKKDKEKDKEQKQYIRVLSNKIDQMINEAGDIRLSRTALEGMLQNNKKSLTDLKGSSNKLLTILKEIEIQAESQIQAKKTEFEEHDDNFDPLEFDRFTRLQELTRFMNEAVSDVDDTVGLMETFLKTEENSIVQQSILTNNLLDNLMKVRLIPVDSISDRLYKITRNTSKELQKAVTLELNGEKTEMDRLVLEKVTSPIEHLLRNCIAHGIESSHERALKKKNSVGKIVMNTFSDGNFIIIEIKDDGAGINIEKVKSIGLKKGLISESDVLSKDDIVNLIFQPGFSTADVVSQVSGRGVGMDVVKSEITALGGFVKIETEKDKGSSFKITLPVAVATSQSMLTVVSDKLVAIPTSFIEEIYSIKQTDLVNGYNTGKVEFRGKNYDLLYAGHALGLVDSKQIPEIKVYNNLIRTSYQDKDVVLHVDKISMTTEVLIKSMGSLFAKFNGIIGATLLGDGRQGIVINPVLLGEHFKKHIVSQKTSGGQSNNKEQDTRKSTRTVLVVDDSITVRRATTKVLEKYGFNVVTAKDGADGLEQLQVVTPDIILSDIEMPRMDGFEFAKNVKNIDSYKNIPIIMITSRTADKHRNYAMELGVSGFLGKPYKEEELIENINKLINIKG